MNQVLKTNKLNQLFFFLILFFSLMDGEYRQVEKLLSLRPSYRYIAKIIH